MFIIGQFGFSDGGAGKWFLHERSGWHHYQWRPYRLADRRETDIHFDSPFRLCALFLVGCSGSVLRCGLGLAKAIGNQVCRGNIAAQVERVTLRLRYWNEPLGRSYAHTENFHAVSNH